jgi:lipoate-protein ligase A
MAVRPTIVIRERWSASEEETEIRNIRLLDLGTVPAVRSQTVYHAVAYAMTEQTLDTIIMVSPGQPYVCIGCHQELEQEVDVAFCQTKGLPILRREVGGGAVYLDHDQIFIQWVFHQGHLPRTIVERFALYIKPLVRTYQALGINAYYRPVNDLHVDGKKIGGTGAAQIGAADVVVGSLMFRFDKAIMSRVLKVSSEKMRDKVFESLEQYMTTMEEQLGSVPDRAATKNLYLRECAEALDAEIRPGDWSTSEEMMASKLDNRFTSDEWLHQKGSLVQSGTKIHQDVRVVETTLKTPGGLVRVTARLREGCIDDLSLSGDFTLLPTSGVAALERSARGLGLEQDTLATQFHNVYQTLGIQSPGVTPEHFAEAVALAASG